MKKKTLLIGAVVWGIIAIIGLGVFVMAMTGNIKLPRLGSRISSLAFASGVELVKEESFSATGLEKLDFSTSYHSMVINLVAGDTLTVRQYDADANNLFTADQSGNALSIKIEPRNLVGVLSISFDPRLEIDLPESYAAAIGLTSSSGTIRYMAEQAADWGDTRIKSSSGTVRFSAALNCKSLELSTSSGTVDIPNLVSQESISLISSSGTINTGDIAANTLSVNTSSGSIRLGEVTTTGTATIQSSSGSHSVGKVNCADFEIRSSSGTLRYMDVSGRGNIGTSSGSISCDKLAVKGNTDISATSGTIHLGLAERQNFELTVSTGSGSISAKGLELFYKDEHGHNAFATVGDGSAGTLSVRTGSGSVRVG